MGNQVFRQESLEQLSSVKVSRDYLHTPSPRLWMLLSVILVLVLGSTIYAFTITRQNVVQATATVVKGIVTEENTTMFVTITIPKSAESAVHAGSPVIIGDVFGKLDAIRTERDGAMKAVVLSMEDEAIVGLEEGTYDAVIILDNISPLGFLSS